LFGGVDMLIEDISPFVFTIGGFGVRWYGLLVAISMLIGLIVLIKHGTRQGLEEDVLYGLAIWIILGGIVGARLVYVLTNLPTFLAFPAEIIRIDHGGLSWHGAILGGAIPGWLYARKHRLDFNHLADLVVPGLATGYFLVRIANIFNQEVLGRPALALGFERHPAQIYGSLIGLTLLIVHNILARKNPPRGVLFWSFVFWYSILRAVFEETARANPLYWPVYVNEAYGLGLFTLTHLVTPPILLLSWYMLRRARSKDERTLTS